MAINWQKLSTIVGLVGGTLGIVVAVSGGVAWVVAYFATQQQLLVVDCYQYFSSEALSAQTEQILLLPRYRDLAEAAAEAQIAHQNDSGNATLLAAYKEAVRVQDEAYETLKAAQDRAKAALKEQDKCGHKGREQLHLQQ